MSEFDDDSGDEIGEGFGGEGKKTLREILMAILIILMMKNFNY